MTLSDLQSLAGELRRGTYSSHSMADPVARSRPLSLAFRRIRLRPGR